MEVAFFLISIILVLFYLFKPITKSEEKNFKNKNNWRGGF
tara:strand:- start:60 stop:179 length:120 start_codon:yes stop_codon:yes gene_type:complete